MKRVFSHKRHCETDPDLSLVNIAVRKKKILAKLEEHERKFTDRQFLAQRSLIQLEQKEAVLL